MAETSIDQTLRCSAASKLIAVEQHHERAKIVDMQKYLKEGHEGAEDQLHLEDVPVDPHRRSSVVVQAKLQDDALQKVLNRAWEYSQRVYTCSGILAYQPQNKPRFNAQRGKRIKATGPRRTRKPVDSQNERSGDM